MHRIGIISDTHGLLRQEVLEILKECDVALHAGDIDRQSVIDELKRQGPLYAVRGNGDREWAENLPGELVLELFGYRFYMVHNKRDISEQAKKADFIIYGHSHKYEEHESGGQVWLNPGSCGKRRFALPVTMAVVEIEAGGYRIIRKDIAGEKAASLKGSKRDQSEIIKAAIKEFQKGTPVESIAEKCRISKELAEQICRMYSTHPGIDVDGIINRITII